MTYEQEGSTIFAIEQNVKFKGRYHDELMWAEIEMADTGTGACTVRWEDEYTKPLIFSRARDAKAFIEKYKHLHTPHINGSSYDG